MSSKMNCTDCVDFPDPVSPEIMVTWYLFTAPIISPFRAQAGRERRPMSMFSSAGDFCLASHVDSIARLVVVEGRQSICLTYLLSLCLPRRTLPCCRTSLAVDAADDTSRSLPGRSTILTICDSSQSTIEKTICSPNRSAPAWSADLRTQLKRIYAGS